MPSTNKLWISFVISLLCILAREATAATALDVTSDNAHRTALDLAVDEAASVFFRNTCHVGLSLAVVDKEGSFFYDYGSTVRGSARLPNKHSIYELASVTKTFTGALAANAIVDDRMSLDGDFRQYLPGTYANLTGRDHPITLRTLVTHRSGLPRDIPDTDDIYAKMDFDTMPRQLLALEKGFDRDRLLSALHAVNLRSEPGEKEAYSNVGFLVLGLGLEKVYGQPFETVMHEKILQPLGMASTDFFVRPANRSRLVNGYDRKGRLMPYHLRNAGAAWGLYSTTEDMAKYVRWQLDANSPVIRVQHHPIVGSAQDGVAMAWNLSAEEDQPALSHSGGSFGMSSAIALYTDQRSGFALLANDTCQGTESALKAVAVAIRDQMHR
jgi:D-alanyl-D-alanine-carboxypeptidase/D-alanyl-D-alanine-endopeptidase